MGKYFWPKATPSPSLPSTSPIAPVAPTVPLSLPSAPTLGMNSLLSSTLYPHLYSAGLRTIPLSGSHGITTRPYAIHDFEKRFEAIERQLALITTYMEAHKKVDT